MAIPLIWYWIIALCHVPAILCFVWIIGWAIYHMIWEDNK